MVIYIYVQLRGSKYCRPFSSFNKVAFFSQFHDDCHLGTNIFGTPKIAALAEAEDIFLRYVSSSSSIIFKCESIRNKHRIAFCNFNPKVFKIFLRMVSFTSDNYSRIYSSNRRPSGYVYSYILFYQCFEYTTSKCTKRTSSL